MPPNLPSDLSTDSRATSGISEPNVSDLYKLNRQSDRDQRTEQIDKFISSGGQEEVPGAPDQPLTPPQPGQTESDEDQQPWDPIAKPPKTEVPTQPQAVTPEEDTGGPGVIDFIEWAASPLLALGDAALAPVAHEYESEDTLGKAGEAFQVSGQAFLSRFFPDINNLPEDYGTAIAENNFPDAPPLAKSSLAATLNVLSDPSTTLGIGALKTFQEGTRAMKVATMDEGVWTLGLKKLLGVLETPGDIEGGVRALDDTKKSLIGKLTGKKASQFDPKDVNDPQIKRMFQAAREADKGDAEALGRLSTMLEGDFGTKLARAKAEKDARTVIPAMNEVLGSFEEPIIRSVKEGPETIPDHIKKRVAMAGIKIQGQEALQQKAAPRRSILAKNRALEDQPKRVINQLRGQVEHLAKEQKRLGTRPTTAQERVLAKNIDETRESLREAVETFGEERVKKLILDDNPNLTKESVNRLMSEKILDTSFAAPQRTTIKGLMIEHADERRLASLSENISTKHVEVNYTKLNNEEDVEQFIETAFAEYGTDLDDLFTSKNLKKEVRILKDASGEEQVFEATDLVADELIARLDPTAAKAQGVEETFRTKTMSAQEVDAWQQDLLEKVIGRKAAKRPAKESYVWRQTLLDSARRIRGLASKVSGQIDKTDADEIALVKAMYLHKILTEKVAGIAPRSSMAALKTLELSANTAMGRMHEIKRLQPLVKETRRIQKVFNQLAPEASDAAITQMVEKMFRASTSDVLYEIFVNNILSGPVTHAINVSSTAFNTLRHPGERLLSAMSSAALGRLDDAGTQLDEFRVMMSGIGESINEMVTLRALHGDTVVKLPEELRRMHELYRVRHHPSITSEALDISGRMGTIIDWFGKGIRLPGDALLKEDIAFKMISYRMSVNEQALTMAKARGRTSKEVKQLYQLLRSHPTDTMAKKGVDLAAYNTFTSTLGSKGSSFNSFRNNMPGVRWIVPFYNTPTNIVKQGVRNSVVGNIYYDLLPALTKNDVAGDLARAKLAAGTGLTGSLVMMLGSDDDGLPLVTGHISAGTPMGRFLQSRGIPGYSIRVHGKWHSYEALEPLKTVLGLLVGYKEAINHIDWEDEGAEALTTELAIATAAPFIKVIGDNYLMPQVQQLNWMLESMMAEDSDRDPHTAYVGTYSKRLASNMLVPNFFNQLKARGGFMEGTPLEGLYDPSFRQSETLVHTIQSRIPGLSSYLPSYPDLWGEERTMPEGLGPDIVSPINTLVPSDDPVDRMIIRLGRQKLMTLPGLKKEIRVVKMDIWEREKYAKLVGQGVPEMGVPPLKEVIRQVVENPIIQQLPDEGKAEIIKQQINQRRSDMDGYFISTNKDFDDRYQKHLQQEQAKFQPVQ